MVADPLHLVPFSSRSAAYCTPFYPLSVFPRISFLPPLFVPRVRRTCYVWISRCFLVCRSWQGLFFWREPRFPRFPPVPPPHLNMPQSRSFTRETNRCLWFLTTQALLLGPVSEIPLLPQCCVFWLGRLGGSWSCFSMCVAGARPIAKTR